MLQTNDITGQSRVTKTKKWKEIFSNFNVLNEAVQFLPRDIKSMQKKLDLLLGEYQSGNWSYMIWNKIVSIPD